MIGGIEKPRVEDGGAMVWQPWWRILALPFNGIDAIEQWLQDDCSFSSQMCFEKDNLPDPALGR